MSVKWPLTAGYTTSAFARDLILLWKLLCIYVTNLTCFSKGLSLVVFPSWGSLFYFSIVLFKHSWRFSSLGPYFHLWKIREFSDFFQRLKKKVLSDSDTVHSFTVSILNSSPSVAQGYVWALETCCTEGSRSYLSTLQCEHGSLFGYIWLKMYTNGQ